MISYVVQKIRYNLKKEMMVKKRDFDDVVDDDT